MEIEAVRHWIEHFVLKHNLCPFAHRPFHDQKIAYLLIEEEDPAEIVFALMEACEALLVEDQETPQTTLLILKSGYEDFMLYLELFELAEHALEIEDLDLDFQLASFHPDYRFAEVDADDPGNKTNRSPYPILHILRRADVEQAIEQHPDTQKIPERNVELLRALFQKK